MAVKVATGSTFRREVATPLFSISDADPTYARWDAAADGRRFLIASRNPDASAREIQIVLSWSTTLQAPKGK